jgi:hypothetical protein
MVSYLEIYNWLVSLGFPESFTQYKNLKDTETGSPFKLYSDATLTIMTSGMVPNLEVNFEDLYPVSIGDLNFTVTDTDVNYVTATVGFKYKIFHVTKL